MLRLSILILIVLQGVKSFAQPADVKKSVVPVAPPAEMQDTSINKKDAGGLKQGLWREKSANMVNEGEYKNDLKEGTWKLYYPDGMLSSIDEYRNGKKNGISVDIKSSGYLRKQCYYINDVLNGRYRLYAQSGKPELESYYTNGKLNGPKKVYYLNSKLQEECNYIDDLRDGVSKWYFEDGKLSIEYTYKKGQLDGVQKTYYKDGSLNSETTYVNNLMQGPYVEYFEGGKIIKVNGSYVADKKNGIWKESDKDGKVIKTEKYKDGQLVK